MTNVNQITNEYGEIMTLADELSDINHNATPIPDREPNKKDFNTGRLIEVKTSDAYGLLAVYLIKKYDPHLHTEIKYGRDGLVKWIEFEGRTYWERRNTIHDRHGKKHG